MSSSPRNDQSLDTAKTRHEYRSDNAEIDSLGVEESDRPSIYHFSSAPAHQSPLRHHTRHPSSPRTVKETRNAHSRYSSSEYDGSAQHRINQYLIQDEIGRGAFGAVHIATDQYGKEYAVKEFSKSRLRRRVKSNMLRRPRPKPSFGHGIPHALGLRAPARGPNKQQGSNEEEDNSFDLIKEEIAVMKKLNHVNLVALIEVLDDPEEDSLYMVLEMCKKGVIMKIDVDHVADPYDDESCRYWFRDLVLGIEYLHAQGVIHRDIKPDNCLLTEDDTLKIVDFGVSEMFEKNTEMKVSKTAGSPAFMAPELCVIKQDNVAGQPADIWSMGVTLYCLRFGKVPFQKLNVLDMYHSICNDPVDLGTDLSNEFRDLMFRLLEKDPAKRIEMPELRNHPWVTKWGTDPLLPEAENCAVLVATPTDAEMNAAITGNMGRLIAVMKAVNRFKSIVEKKRPQLMESILGGQSPMVQPPLFVHQEESHLHKSKSLDVSDRQPIERVVVAEGMHRKIEVSDDLKRLPLQLQTNAQISNGASTDLSKQREQAGYSANQSRTWTDPEAMPRSGGKGQAHDPLEDHVYVHIGPGPGPPDAESGDGVEGLVRTFSVSESPGIVDHDVFETAYKDQIDKIVDDHMQKGSRPTIYLTRRVEQCQGFRDNPNIITGDEWKPPERSSLANLIGRATGKAQGSEALGQAVNKAQETVASAGLRRNA